MSYEDNLALAYDQVRRGMLPVLPVDARTPFEAFLDQPRPIDRDWTPEQRIVELERLRGEYWRDRMMSGPKVQRARRVA